jgi:hypothetical protein
MAVHAYGGQRVLELSHSLYGVGGLYGDTAFFNWAAQLDFDMLSRIKDYVAVLLAERSNAFSICRRHTPSHLK